MLDNDRIKASYAFRPLTRHKYISKHKDGSVYALKKGRELIPNAMPLVSLGGGNNERINQISRTVMLLRKAGVNIVSFPKNTQEDCFIPSACWRKIRTNILSTTRFMGILYVGSHRLAVYDIGDGTMDWQLRAERSLFFTVFHEDFDTHATGMLFICDEEKRIEIAKKIIRETMWRRKQLIENNNYIERLRPVKYSKAPIRLNHYYERVYLTTPATLKESISRIKTEEDFILNYPQIFSVNPATDLLKFVYFFSAVKSDACSDYSIALPKQDFPILQMYPDVLNVEGIRVYECKY